MGIGDSEVQLDAELDPELAAAHEARRGMQRDIHWMRIALAQARHAALRGEVPVGAVLVRGTQVLATGANAQIATADPTAHAEILALRSAAKRVGNYRLTGTTLYVTIEPCTMCAGALIHARIDRLVFGAAEPRGGAVQSTANVLANPGLNHRIEVCGGVLAEDAADLLRCFFAARRTPRGVAVAAATGLAIARPALPTTERPDSETPNAEPPVDKSGLSREGE